MKDLHISGETSPCHTQWALQLRLIEDEPAPPSSLMLRHLRNHLSPLWTNMLLSSFGFTKAKPSFITPPTKENWIRSSHLQSHTWEVRKPKICPKKKKIKKWNVCCSHVCDRHAPWHCASFQLRQEFQPTTDGPGWGEEPAFHAVLGKSAKRCVQDSGFLIFLRNYTAVVHRKDIFLSDCFPYLVFHYQRVSQCI